MSDADQTPPPSDDSDDATPAAAAWFARSSARFDDWLSARIERHVVAAFIMVAISVLGAVAAYRVGLAEQHGAIFERRLALGQLQDISFRQQLLAELLVQNSFANAEKQLTNEAADLRRAHDLLAAQSKGAVWLAWRAAEMTAQQNAIRSFTVFLRGLRDRNVSLERQLAEGSVEELRRQGFDAMVDPSPSPRSAVIFPSLHDAIVEAHENSAWLAFCVLLYVLGLVCLTFAELSRWRPVAWATLAAAGIVIASVATAAVFVADPNAAWTIAPLAALLAAAGVLAARRDLFRLSSDAAHTPHPEAPEPARVSFAHLTGHSSHDAWSRSIVLFITAAVFVSAVFGWLYSVSLNHAGHFALEAQQKKTELVNQRGRMGAISSGTVFENAITILTLRVRCSSATQLAALAEEGIVAIAFVRAEDERKRRCAELKQKSEERAYIVELVDDGGLADSGSRPARRLNDLVMDQEGGPHETLALSDGFAEISVGWSKRAALLLAVLTILAIALYLFGQAYAMGETVAGRWLIRSGAALVGVSILLGVYAWGRPVVEAPGALPVSCGGDVAVNAGTEKAGTEKHDADEEAKTAGHGAADEFTRLAELAARKYAEGVRLRNAGVAAPSGSRARFASDTAAVDSLNCAVAARPGFILAYQALVGTLGFIQSPQRDETTFISLYSRARLAEMSDLLRRELTAFENAGMLRPRERVAMYAFVTTMLAFNEDPSALDEARTALDMVTGTASWLRRLQVRWLRPELVSKELPSRDKADQLNLALLSLATGEADQISEAERIYDDVLKAGDWSSGLRAGTLTDLEVLDMYCPKLHSQTEACARIKAAAARIRPLVAGGVAATDVPESEAKADSFVAHATPSSLAWRARVEGFDPRRDRLTVAWYRDDTREPDDAWNGFVWQLKRALPAFLEVYHPGGPALPAAAADGIVGHEALSIDAAGICLRSGRYLAELYLNGRHIASQHARVDAGDLRLVRSRELDLNWCVPEMWRHWPAQPAWSASMPMRGFQSPWSRPSGPPDAAMSTFFAPPSMREDMRKAYFLRRAIQTLLRKGEKGLPGSLWTQATEDRLLRAAVPLEALSAEDCASKIELGRFVYRTFTHRSEKNLIHVGVAGGTASGAEACAILRSLANHF